MLKPAVLYEEVINRRLKSVPYEKEYWYYLNNRTCINNCSLISDNSRVHQFVSVNVKTDEVIGFIEYGINPIINRVTYVSAIHFRDKDKNNCDFSFSADFIQCLMEMFEVYHFRSVEFGANDRNPSINMYDKIIKMTNGVRLYHTRESTITPDGIISGEIGYEILASDYMESKAHQVYLKLFDNRN